MKYHQILIVDDDPGTIQVLGSVLSDVGEIRVATDGKSALRLAREALPDLILLDAEMPDMTGFQVCETLKADRELAAVPVIFITSHCEDAFEIAGLEMGAADFIGKPINPPLVLARVKTQLRVKDLTDELLRISTIDALTGMPNREHFDHSLERECLRARRSAEPICLLLVDVDRFTLFNNRYGYQAGDECLRTVAMALAIACLRPADVVARFNGQEFAILLPLTERRGAEHVARRVLDSMEKLRIPDGSSTSAPHVTCSIGIACYDQYSKNWEEASPEWRLPDGKRDGASPGRLVKTARTALSFAKHAGRARARLLDISDFDNPGVARDIVASPRDQAPLERV
jgi:diguanylate cyclase (GGDEF)-like protein